MTSRVCHGGNVVRGSSAWPMVGGRRCRSLSTPPIVRKPWGGWMPLPRWERTAADLGAWLCFQDESGQGLRPLKGRTWGRRGRTPVVTVTGGHNTRVSLAALIATRPGCQPRLIYRTHRAGRRDGRRKGFTETGYARLLDAAHQPLGGPIVLLWDYVPDEAHGCPANRQPGSPGPQPGNRSAQPSIPSHKNPADIGHNGRCRHRSPNPSRLLPCCRRGEGPAQVKDARHHAGGTRPNRKGNQAGHRCGRDQHYGSLTCGLAVWIHRFLFSRLPTAVESLHARTL